MALALDGSPAVGGTGSGFSLALPGLTTANSNDVIIAISITNDGGVISATSPNLTFTLRATGGSGNNTLNELYAIASSPLTNEIITIHCSTNATFISGIAFGVSGANTSIPFDTNPSIPTVGTTSPLTVSTTAANTMVIGSFRQASVANPTAGAGYTLISGANFMCAEYRVFSSAQSGLSVNESNDADVNGSIADALIAAVGQTVTPSAGSIVFTGSTPTANVAVFPGKGVLTATGFVPGIKIVPGPSPFHVGGAPDDQDDRDYSWLAYDAKEAEEKRKRRLDAMRREIGLLPPDVAAPVIKKADKEVEAAVKAIVSKPNAIDTKADFDRATKKYEWAYAAAFRQILDDARQSDLHDAFIAEVRQRVQKETARRLRIQRDDDEVIEMLGGLL